MIEKTELQLQCIEFAKDGKAGGFIWKDITSYSRYDKERIPNTFETQVSDLKISITCGHVHYKDSWIFHCHKLGYDTAFLCLSKGVSPVQAAEMAIGLCRVKISNWYNALSL